MNQARRASRTCERRGKRPTVAELKRKQDERIGILIAIFMALATSVQYNG